MESYMDWVNNHFTEANNGRYLEMYKLADGLIKEFLDKGFDTVRYHEEGKNKQMCISFIRDNERVFVTFDQGKQKWFIDFQKVTKDKRGMRAKCGIIEDIAYKVYKAHGSREAVKAHTKYGKFVVIDEKGNLVEEGIEKVIEVMERLQEENKK